MRVIAETGRFVVAEDGPNVVVIDRGGGRIQILVFVLLVLALVFGGFGLATLVMTAAGIASGVPAEISAALFGVGVLAAAGMVYGARSLRRRRLAPLESYRPVAVFDRSRRTFIDADGRSVARLDEVGIQRRMQLGSSSPKLVVLAPSGEWVLLRANPFGGSIGNLDEVLRHAIATPKAWP
ncbi:hypothetical protein PDG61_09255 [Mycolicibacterium sp. BiH015]|uniref:hypothetical protein n=1 Tax=Mycolicibacterium sp. BiH015 TaxID=3018808 RepID=UPI0022DED0D2|nr:hypothetical protein [Mycolicibacterium sp. BiH015]MDA2891098.1 hypothetical protein [Mycolicibacterium sp. BiH015]